jgi:hypothetical protein
MLTSANAVLVAVNNFCLKLCFCSSSVLSPDARNSLHQAASKAGLGHKTFSRPLTGKSGMLEQALDSILTGLGDDSKYVEYWTRQEWRSIEAHADVDEFLAKKEDADGTGSRDSFRYPHNGHVLYLQVGTNVRGPTCIFPNRQSGGDLLRKHANNDGVELVTVPAVPGRMLRFQGDYLHAVPRPTDFWLLKFVQGAPKFEPEEEWGRSVVLFNTWGDEPPSDVAVESTTTDQEAESTSVTERSEWSEVYNLSQEDDTRLPEDDSAERVAAKVWLLGNQRRRDYPGRTLKLVAPSNLRTALYEESIVSLILLEQP